MPCLKPRLFSTLGKAHDNIDLIEYTNVQSRALDVHQLITIPAPPRRRHPAGPAELNSGPSPNGEPFMPPRPQSAPIMKWVQENTATWNASAYEPMPADDVDTIYDTKGEDSANYADEDSKSVDTDFGDEPLILEAIPPYEPFSSGGHDNTLFGLHTQLRQGAVITTSRTPKRAPEPSQTRSQNLAQTQPHRSTWTGIFEETEYPGYIGSQSFCPSPPAHDLSDLTCSSGSLSSSSGGMQCTTNIGELLAIELRHATARCSSVCRWLRRKLRR